jgi:hypothetical protein
MLSPLIWKSANDKGSSCINLEIVSAQGIEQAITSNIGLKAIKEDYYNDLESYLNVQAHILIGGDIYRSEPITIGSNKENEDDDIIFGYKIEHHYSITKNNNIMEQPILIYLSYTLGNGSSQQPIGIAFTKSTFCLGIIDPKVICHHNNELLRVELLPSNNGMDTGFPCSMFIRASFLLPKFDMGLNDNSSNVPSFLADGSAIIQKARAWFAKARVTYPFIEGRDIKLVAEDEAGQHRMVCSFINPIIASRDIDSPKLSARFVSLIPFKRDLSLAGGRVCTWNSPHAFLTNLQGDVEDHAILLCSLLLGWGMDAWVAMGTIASPGRNTTTLNNHVWVVTMDAASDGYVIFWETLTGQQYKVKIETDRKNKFLMSRSNTDKNNHPFSNIYAMFRHDTFLLNVQRNTSLVVNEESISNPTLTFNLTNTNHWLPFQLKNLNTHPGCKVHIPSSVMNASSTRNVELNVENLIKNAIKSWRTEAGLSTNFDEKLELLLQPALFAYEMDRSLGISIGNEDFQNSIKRFVHKGYSFRAYPTCFSHANVPSIASSIRQAAAFKQVLYVHSSSATAATKLGVRVKIFPYPEGIMALWIMIAAVYE